MSNISHMSACLCPASASPAAWGPGCGWSSIAAAAGRSSQCPPLCGSHSWTRVCPPVNDKIFKWNIAFDWIPHFLFWSEAAVCKKRIMMAETLTFFSFQSLQNLFPLYLLSAFPSFQYCYQRAKVVLFPLHCLDPLLVCPVLIVYCLYLYCLSCQPSLLLILFLFLWV